MTVFQNFPNRIFPFEVSGCDQLIQGAECDLHTGKTQNGGTLGVPIYSDGHVGVTTTSTSVTFTVLDWGYFDGPGSTITFSTSTGPRGHLVLTQTANANVSEAFVTIAVTMFGKAESGWRTQAANLDNVLSR